MKLNKNQLGEIKEFLEYLKLNTTVKEKKALVTLSGVDITLILSTLYCLFEETSDFDFIAQGFSAIGVTTGILVLLFSVYKKEKDKSNSKVLKR